MEVRFRARFYSTTCAVSGVVTVKQRWEEKASAVELNKLYAKSERAYLLDAPQAMPDSPSNPPMSTYCERTLTERRDFELHSDRLIVRVRTAFVRSGERTIVLAELNPNPERGVLRVRHNASFAGFVLALFALMVVAGNIDWRQTDFAWFSYPAGLIALGMLFVMFYRRRIAYRLFSFKSGAVAFDVMRRGKYREDFGA